MPDRAINGTEGASWDVRLLDLAADVAEMSKDPSTRVGALVVDDLNNVRILGFNGFPREMVDDDRLHDRELKYKLVVHAEMNALCTAARVGMPLDGCRLYVTFPPCSNCAKHIVQMGIGIVVFPDREIPERWQDDVTLSMAIFKECGVYVRKGAILT
jgi:dCMP deaminase